MTKTNKTELYKSLIYADVIFDCVIVFSAAISQNYWLLLLLFINGIDKLTKFKKIKNGEYK